MDEKTLTYRDFARFAAQDADAIAAACRVDVFRATGPGGQGVNTTDSAVRMVHLPSGIAVVSRESRSQFQNRAACVRKLKAEFERRARPPRRRIETKPTRASRERRLKAKRAAAEKKRFRRPPREDE